MEFSRAFSVSNTRVEDLTDRVESLSRLEIRIVQEIYAIMDDIALSKKWKAHFKKNYTFKPSGMSNLKFLFNDETRTWVYCEFGRDLLTPSTEEVEQIIAEAIEIALTQKYGRYKFLKALESSKARILIEAYGNFLG
jgi:hypothetical protein